MGLTCSEQFPVQRSWLFAQTMLSVQLIPSKSWSVSHQFFFYVHSLLSSLPKPQPA